MCDLCLLGDQRYTSLNLTKFRFRPLQVLSTLMMFTRDCVLSTVRTFTPAPVCALGLETWVGPGLSLSWKTPRLRLNVSAQMSGVWS